MKTTTILDGRLEFGPHGILLHSGLNHANGFRDKLATYGYMLFEDEGGFSLRKRTAIDNVVYMFKDAQELWDFLPLYVPNVWNPD